MNQQLISGVLVFFLGLKGIGCIVSPPIRSTMGGTPGKLDQGDIEVGFDASMSTPLPTVAPSVSVSLLDYLTLELGGNITPLSDDKVEPEDNGSSGWAMASGGLRVLLQRGVPGDVVFTSDIEFGFGAGVGGTRSCDSQPDCTDLGCSSHFDPPCSEYPFDGMHWSERFAFGGYLGFGAGWTWSDFFSVYLRSRGTISHAEGIPTTFYLRGIAGLEFHIFNRLHIRAGVVGGTVLNSMESSIIFGGEVGLSYVF